MPVRTPNPDELPDGFSLPELAEAVNAWCLEAGLTPANGQVGESLSERNIRYYRTIGLVDAPVSGSGRGYTEKHLLQLTGIRLLQAQGLPLRRIRELLFGRSLAELREVRDRGRAEAQVRRTTPGSGLTLTPGEAWQLVPLSSDLALLHKGQTPISPEKLRQIRDLLQV
jgi:DNA-binding transcriptional MerR regulator